MLNLELVSRRQSRSVAVGMKEAMRSSVSLVMPSPSSGHIVGRARPDSPNPAALKL